MTDTKNCEIGIAQVRSRANSGKYYQVRLTTFIADNLRDQIRDLGTLSKILFTDTFPHEEDSAPYTWMTLSFREVITHQCHLRRSKIFREEAEDVALDLARLLSSQGMNIRLNPHLQDYRK